jgi:hypothetical protein
VLIAAKIVKHAMARLITALHAIMDCIWMAVNAKAPVEKENTI